MPDETTQKHSLHSQQKMMMMMMMMKFVLFLSAYLLPTHMFHLVSWLIFYFLKVLFTL